jgi:hypothetical protein
LGLFAQRQAFQLIEQYKLRLIDHQASQATGLPTNCRAMPRDAIAGKEKT